MSAEKFWFSVDRGATENTHYISSSPMPHTLEDRPGRHFIMEHCSDKSRYVAEL